MEKKETFQRDEILYDGNDHMLDFPVYKKSIVIDDNGDQHEEYEEISKDELRKHRSLSLFQGIINGNVTADVNHYDKFQLMDMLEQMIDDLPQEEIDNLMGRKHE